MPYVLSDMMATRLRELARQRGGASAGSLVSAGDSALTFVRCTSATAAGAGILAECYPGVVIRPASDKAMPPEESENGYVLLTLIGTAGVSVAPVVGVVYECVIGGDVAADGQGSIVVGRPRAFGVGTVPAPWKPAVRVATRVAGTLATSFAAWQVVDGVTLVAGDRILIKAQAVAAENGIYVVGTGGAPARAADASSGQAMMGAMVAVSEGAGDAAFPFSAQADTVWLCTADAPIVLGTTALPWVPIVRGPAGATPNAVARWDGATGAKVADSLVLIDNAGNVNITDAILSVRSSVTPVSVRPNSYVYVDQTLTDPEGGFGVTTVVTGAPPIRQYTFYGNYLRAAVRVPVTQNFFLEGTFDDGSGATNIISSFGVVRGTVGGSQTRYIGIDGPIAPGMVFTGGICTGAGAGTIGTLTAVSVTSANGITGTSSGGATPALTLTLGAITPASVAATGAVTAASLAVTGAITGASLAATGTVTGSNLSGANTGDVPPEDATYSIAGSVFGS